MKRIFFVTPSLDRYSGMAINELQLATALSKFMQVYLFGFKEIGQPAYYTKNENRNLTILCFPTIRGITSLFYPLISIILSIVASLMRASGLVDQIYCRDSLLAIGFLLSKRNAKITVVKIPCIIEDEKSGNLPKRFFSFIYGATDKTCIRRAGFIAVPSATSSLQLFSRRKVSPINRPLIIPAGVDLELIKNIKIARKYGEQKSVFRIGFVGTLYWWQGLDLLVKALILIKQNAESMIEFHVIGDGPQRKEIEKMCKEHGLEYTITGFVPHKQALELLGSLDLLVLPRHKTSSTEGIVPLKVFEAWALGVPVIATGHKVFTDNFEDGVDMLLCQENPTDIASKIKEVLGDNSLRTRLSCQGINLARNYSYKKIAERLANCVP